MTNTVAEELITTVEAAYEQLRMLAEPHVSTKPAPGKWSKKELIGHLIDSATNNHQRFIRAQQVEPFIFPRYEQDDWVDRQRYNTGSWEELVDLWRLYNRHLSRVIEGIPEEKLGVICTIGPYEPVTLAYLVEDYLAHLRHHLRQLGTL